MIWLLALALAQPSLNLNQQPIESRLGGRRMSSTRQFAIDCYGGTACSVDGGVLRIWTADAGAAASSGSGAPVDGGFVVWTSVGSSNERVLSAGTNTVIDTATPGQIQVDITTPVASATALAVDPTACGANNYVTDVAANGTLTCSIPPGTYTLPDATSLVTGGIRLTTDLGGTATAPTVVDDSHAHTGSTISALDTGDVTTGTLGQARGGTGVGSTTCAAGEYLTSNGTLYSCSTPAGGSGYTTIQDDGAPLTARTTVDFTGAGVTCTDTGAKTSCDIPSGGSGGASPLSLILGTP